jgi:hypothetical protein
MTVFYRSKELVVDSEAIMELLSQQRFALSELSQVHIARRDDQSNRVAMPTIVGALVLVVATGSELDTPAGRAAVALSAVMVLGLGGVSHLFRRSRWQLMAVYRGADVCLCSTTDAHLFGQVRRGLVRALEAHHRY